MVKKPYVKPAIIHSEKVEARAALCSRSTDACGPSGPITS